MAPYDLRIRTKEYSIAIMTFVRGIPRQFHLRSMGRQLFRSATSVGANYREGCRSRSDAEYATKLTQGLMELEESMYWLELLEGSHAISPAQITPLMQETNELTAIFVTMIRKAREKLDPVS